MKADCIIIGAGPCGTQAAIYLKRYGFNPIVIAKDGGALENVKEIENYYGFVNISGKKLLENGYEQLKHFDIPFIKEEVVEVEYLDSFIVKTISQVYEAKTIAIACGAARNNDIRADKFLGSGVSYCAICDGFFFKNKKVALIGAGGYMASELNVLKNIIKDITIFTDGEKLSVNTDGFKVITDKIDSFNGDGHLSSITANSINYEIDGAFIAKGAQSGFSIAKHLGLALEGNYIKVDQNLKTNIPGVFAGGDAVLGLHQIAKAVADGAIMATSISNHLKNNY